MSELGQEYLQRLEKRVVEKGVSNEFLVSLLKLSETYLNLQRLSDYAKENNKTTQGLRRFKKDKIIKICDYQLIINND
jgi:hypothetical protein